MGKCQLLSRQNGLFLIRQVVLKVLWILKKKPIVVEKAWLKRKWFVLSKIKIKYFICYTPSLKPFILSSLTVSQDWNHRFHTKINKNHKSRFENKPNRISLRNLEDMALLSTSLMHTRLLFHRNWKKRWMTFYHWYQFWNSTKQMPS